MPRLTLTNLLKRMQAGHGNSPAPARRARRSNHSTIPAIVERLEVRVLLSAATVDLPNASSVTTTTASLDGNISADGGSSVTERGFLYALTSVNSTPQIGDLNAVKVVDAGTGTGSFSIPITGLDPHSNYTIVAYAINGDGTAYSSTSSFTTLETPSLVVTTASDVVDATDGLTSLREAILLANSQSGADTITFGGPVFTDANPDTITLSLGQLAITDSVTINGTGASSLTIDGNNSSRVFYLYNNSATLDITLSGMTITGGSANQGGGIIDFDENLTLVDSVVTGNSATGKGGGLWADGFNMTLTIRRTEISGNTSGDDGGGIYVEDTGGLLTIEDSTISGNQAGGDGGGIYFYDPDHDILITRSTISGNTAVGKGGGIYLYSMDSGTFTIENSTITGNQAAVGGGVYLYDVDNPFIIRNSTIANNTATSGGGGLDVYNLYNANLSIYNTILAGNTTNGTPDDLLIQQGTLGTVNNNLIQDTASTTLDGSTASGNILGQDPLLGTLGNHGGYTQTMAIAANSPARNAGSAVDAATTDQRGVTRDSLPDIGAFELQPPALANIETTPLPYPPNGAATVITSTLTLTDEGSATIASATVTISGGLQSGDTLTFANTANITGVYNAGTLTLTGTDTLANYQAALRSVKYSSTSQSPAARTVSFQVNDGTNPSDVVSRTVGGYAQLVGTALNVYGTPLVDVITVDEGATLDIVVAGVLTQFTPAQVTSISIFGFAGDDSIQINSLANGTALTAYGMGGNDTIRVNAAVTQSVTLNGGTESDLLIGGSGNDTLIGGAGDDWLNGGEGSDSLTGGVGNDVYAFSEASINQLDTIFEVAGDASDALNFGAMTTAVTVNLTSDTALATMSHRIVKVGVAGQSANIENVFGGAGNDNITGNAAANLLYGNGGNDTISGGDGNDLLDGGQGNDLLKGGNQDDILIGGAGDDYLRGEAGNDSLNGGDGSDTLAGGDNDDLYLFTTATINELDTIVELANQGRDTLDFSALTASVRVDLTSDTALGTMAHRIVQASAGQSANLENVVGGSGADRIVGNALSNTLIGGDGDDVLLGGGGDDVLLGGAGGDTLFGEAGNDKLDGGEGSDYLSGGTEDDTYVFLPAIVNQTDYVLELSNQGNDTLDFSTATATVTVDLNVSTLAIMDRRIVQAATVPASIETVIGGSGNDQITGNSSDNLLIGNGGNDTISGGGGNDVLLGGQGNDTLKGISGRNILIGGAGADLLLGGSDDDLLLSGSTIYESDPVILKALLAEWASANTYQQRVDHLTGVAGGGANTSFVFSSTTVTNDAVADYLTGGGGRDWFLANSLQDSISDKAVDEIFTHIDTWL